MQNVSYGWIAVYAPAEAASIDMPHPQATFPSGRISSMYWVRPLVAPGVISPL